MIHPIEQGSIPMKFSISLVAILSIAFNTLVFTATSSVTLAQSGSESTESKDYTESQKKLIEYGLRPQETIDYTDTIRKTQQKLKDLGYYQYAVDGIVGPRTIQAIINFQIELDLYINGNIDS
jgi:peptidoglycan hydrolase-like protein with peptidoglycan-binding domain